MKKSVLVLFKAALILMGCVASTGLYAQTNQSLLWKISGKGLENPSYLFGTMHAICEDDMFLPEATKAAVTSTDQLVLELDMDEPNMMMEMAQLMMDMEGVDYKGKLSEMAYNKLDSIMKSKTGLGMQMGRMMKPFALMSVATMSLLDCSEPDAYEEVLMNLAKEKGNEVLGLETGEFQMSIFDDIPQSEQIQWLEEMMADFSTAKAQFDEMTRLYLSQDVEELYSSFDDYKEYEKYEEALLSNRNKNWIPKMEEMMKDKSSFFGVGAMHLGGENGVINLLKEAGYTVEAVENK